MSAANQAAVKGDPTVAASDLNRYTIVGDQEATEHGWLLGGSSASLKSRIGTRTLVPQDPGTPPGYSPGYITMPAAGQKSLKTEVKDTTTLKVTLGVLFRYQSTIPNPVVLWHDLTGETGLSIFLSAGPGLKLNLKPTATIESPLFFNAQNAWYFVVVSLDFGLAENNVRVFSKGRAMQVHTAPGHAPTPGGVIALGRQYGLGANAFDVADAFVYVDQFVTEATFAAMLARAEKRAAAKGITIASAAAAAA